MSKVGWWCTALCNPAAWDSGIRKVTALERDCCGEPEDPWFSLLKPFLAFTKAPFHTCCGPQDLFLVPLSQLSVGFLPVCRLDFCVASPSCPSPSREEMGFCLTGGVDGRYSGNERVDNRCRKSLSASREGKVGESLRRQEVPLGALLPLSLPPCTKWTSQDCSMVLWYASVWLGRGEG